MATIAEVYAVNVTKQAISKFIGCDPKNKEKIEECRADLLDFLKEKESWGTVYENQDLAWQAYKEWQIMYSSPEEFVHLDEEAIEMEDWSHWLEEAMQALYERTNTMDMLANYSFENSKPGSSRFPAQM